MIAGVAEWIPVDARRDPFLAHRPANLVCAPFGHGPEGAFFEIDTGLCNYGTFTQALRQPVPAGSTLEFVFWHLALWGPEDARAHVAVQIADELVWQVDLALPVEEKAADVALIAPQSFDEGEAVYFHVHNHGSNNYRLGPISLRE